MVTKLVFTTERPTFLDEYDIDILDTFDLDERHAAKIEIQSDSHLEQILRSLEADERIEGIEDSFDAHLR